MSVRAGRGGKLPLIELAARRCAEAGVDLSRERLQALILCGDVVVDDERCRDPRRPCAPGARLECPAIPGLSSLAAAGEGKDAATAPDRIPPPPFVSRGGDKLDPVLAAWGVPVAGRVWLDAGCSTGGFTHCLLLRGAAVVHAVDVGYNQLDWRLRSCPAVLVRERTNIMSLESLDPAPEAAVADLSFRSMAGAARRILELTTGNELYALVKPQFERKYWKKEGGAGAGAGFSGVVEAGELGEILADVVGRLAAEGVALERIAPAGLKGRTGNQEYIALLRRGADGAAGLAGRGLAALREGLRG